MAIGTKITLAGAKLLAKALGGKQLKFTRGAFGDAIQNGSMKTPTTAERDALTALIHEKMSLPITGYEIVDDQIIVSLQVKNESVTEDFRIAEMGLFAKDPDSGQEKLYAYTFQGNDGDKMYAANTDVQLEFQVELVTKICGAANVTAVITRTYEGLTQADLDAHIASSLPHPNWEVVKAGVGLSKSSNTLNVKTASSTLLGGIKVGQNLYMSGDSLNAVAGDSDVESRLRQIEINQSNLYVLLEQAYGLGVQANLLMVENFKTLKATGTFEAGASIAADNSSTITIDDCSQARDGGYYVLTDGLACNQLVKVTAVERVNAENFILTVTPKAKEKSTRDLGKLMRSSVTIKDNKAYGAGLLKTKRRHKNKTWKGTGTSNTDNLVFYFPSVESAADFDGDWSVTSDGYFTLD